MKHLYNFKIFERKITIDFPDNLLDEFKEEVNIFFEDKNIKNKEKLIDELAKKFAKDAIDNYFYPSGQGAEQVELFNILGVYDDEIEEGVFDLLSKREYREIILKDNEDEMISKFIDKIIEDSYTVDLKKYKTYIDAKKYNL